MPEKKKSYVEMYLDHLAELQEIDKQIEVILDTTEEEANWLKKKK